MGPENLRAFLTLHAQVKLDLEERHSTLCRRERIVLVVRDEWTLSPVTRALFEHLAAAEQRAAADRP